jgi:hypothetical protein
MSNLLELYTITTNKNKLNKTGGIVSKFHDIAFEFKSNYNLKNPTILVNQIALTYNMLEFTECNYARIIIIDSDDEYTTKYYFVKNITFISNDLCEMELLEDVLFTFKDSILTMNLFVERSTNLGSSFISDPLQTISNSIEIDTMDLGVDDAESNYYNVISFAPERYVLNTLSYLPIISIGTGKSTNLYGDKVGTYTDVSYAIQASAPSDIAPIIQKVKTDAGFASSVISFYGLPITSTKADEIFTYTNTNLINYNVITSSISALQNAIFDTSYTSSVFDVSGTSARGKVKNLESGPLMHIHVITFDVPEVTNWIEMEKYKYILQLPFVGQKEIDIREYANSTIKIYLDVTLKTGDVIMLCVNDTDSRILWTEDISAMLRVDVSSTNALENKNQLMMMGTQALTKYASNVASLASPKQTPLGFGADVFANLWGTTQAEKTLIPKASLSGSSALGSYIFSIAPILYRIKTIYDPLDSNEFGKPCNRMSVVNTLSGFAKFGGSFKNVIINGTDEERDELIALLKEGIII